MIDCPACGDSMEEISLDDVLIDRCNNCQGVWLDEGEDADLSREPLTADEMLLKKKLELLSEYQSQATPKQTDRSCPRCAAGLEVINYRKIPGLKVEECPEGCGLFLDHGELTKIQLLD